ncbi:MAG: hypothetical protein RIF39_13040, partial [Cyclobacteriaceae bacterium]
QLATQHEIPDWVANYTNSTGSPTFRDKVASFYSKFLTKCEIDPEHLHYQLVQLLSLILPHGFWENPVM